MVFPQAFNASALVGLKEKDRAKWERSWDNYTLAQKRVIARFLEFIALNDGLAQDAQLAWQSYWFKFGQ